MSMVAEDVDAVVGVDTHTDTHTACLLDVLGRVVGTRVAATDPAGYAELLGWAVEHAPGPRVVWAVEGARSHGAGLTRALRAAGCQVVEAPRPRRASRRPGGKSDPNDAEHAARAALAAARHVEPRCDGDREALRVLLVARRYLTTTRTATVNVFKSLILTAPDSVRQKLRGQTTTAQVRAATTLRVTTRHDLAERTLREQLRQLALAVRAFDRQITDNSTQLRALVENTNPTLLAEPGVGPVSAAQLLVSWSHPGRVRSEAAFAALAGASPIEASSGRTVRHRLNRFGDRQLNRALHTIATWRMHHDPATQPYLDRSRRAGKTDPEIRRNLKRYLARALYRLMEQHAATTT